MQISGTRPTFGVNLPASAAMPDYVLKGYLTDATAGTPLPGLRIECWDHLGGLEKDTYLAGGVSGKNGEFSVAFDSVGITGSDTGRLPDAYFKVFSGETLVDTTEETVLGAVKPGVHDVGVVVRLPLEIAAALDVVSVLKTGTTYKVSGRVTSGGEPVSGAGVSVVGYKLPGEPTLAETKTGSSGHFSVVLGHEGEARLGNGDDLGTTYRFVVTFQDGSTESVESGVSVGAEIELDVTAPPATSSGSADSLQDIVNARFGKTGPEAATALTLSGEGILTLGDIRRAGGLPPDAEGLKGASYLTALADLDAVVPDPIVSRLLADLGIDSVEKLARAPASAVEAVLQTESTDALQAAALLYLAERDRLIVETVMASAAGQALPDGLENDPDLARAITGGDTFPSSEGCMGAAGPVAYLAALIDLASASVYESGASVTPQTLADRMHLDILNLPTACDALTQETLQARLVAEGLALQIGDGEVLTSLLAEYARSASYPALLAELGTSYEELALARSVGRSPAAKRRLAERLGLPGSASLAALTLDPDARTPQALATLFGLTPIFRTTDVPLPASRLLTDRRTYLRRQWFAQDWGDTRTRVSFPASDQTTISLKATAPPPATPVDDRPQPLVDPTVIGSEDIRPRTAANGSNPALALWATRHDEAATYATTVQTEISGFTQSTGEDRPSAFASFLQSEIDLARAGNTSTYPSWVALFDAVDAGRDTSAAAARLDLRPSELALLAQAYRSLAAAPLQGGAADSVSDVFTAVWARRRAEAWRTAENDLGITLSPDFFQITEGQGAPGRRSALQGELRRAWRRTLAARAEQDRGLEDALRQATLAAEAIALRTSIGAPARTLVDHLARLAFPAGGADRVRSELMLDADVDPAVRTTRLAHTTSVMQILLGRLREGYAIRGMTLPDDAGRTTFDARWQWTSTYDTWRAAMGTYLFPENTALPYARPETTEAYQQLIAALTPSGAGAPDEDPLTPYIEYTEELQSLMPMAGCRAMVRDLPGGTQSASFTAHTFAFGWSWRTGGIYWSATPDPSHLDAPRRFLWAPLPKLPESDPTLGAYQPIGAVPYELSDGPRYVCLFMQRGDDPTLLLYRFDLDSGEWIDGSEPNTAWYPVRIGQQYSGQT